MLFEGGFFCLMMNIWFGSLADGESQSHEVSSERCGETMAIVLTIDDLKSDELRWNNVIWKNAERIVRHLQTRIVKAVKVGNHKRVRSLHRLLTQSLSTRLLVLKRITTNRGKLFYRLLQNTVKIEPVTFDQIKKNVNIN